MEFLRKPLRDDIQKEILKRIVGGSLAGGQRINETHLASDLGLSRTPLREAMLGLTANGHLISHMGRGFAVPQLTREQWGQVQEMLGLLQPVALAKSAQLTPETIMVLSNHLNRARMALTRDNSGKSAGRALAGLVFNWSESLLGSCPATILVQDINRLEELAARYWYAAGCQGWNSQDLQASFSGLYELLRQGKIDRASQVWASHIEKFSQEILGTLPQSQAD